MASLHHLAPPRRLVKTGAILLLASILLGAAVRAEPESLTVQVVAADGSETNKGVAVALRRRLQAGPTANDINRRPLKSRPLFVAVGAAALRSLLSQGAEGAILAVSCTSQSYHDIIEDFPARAVQVSAIFSDPAPLVQLQLLALLYRQSPSAGVILSPRSAYLEPLLQRAAAQTGVRLTVVYHDDSAKLNQTLAGLADVQALLATPDSSVYNPDTVRNILLTAYRRNQAVVGYSPALVRAGALATSYADTDDLLAQVDELVTGFANTGRLPEPQFPRYFSVLFNENVARSLNIPIEAPVRQLSRKGPQR